MSTRTKRRAALADPGTWMTIHDAVAEPSRKATVAGVRGVPTARSWIRDAQPVHHQLVRALLRGLPGGRVTRVTGWGDQSSAWAACHDHGGYWEIPYDETAAERDLATARASHPTAGGGRRLIRLVAAFAVLVLAAWTASVLLDAGHAAEQTRQAVGVAAAAVAFIVGLGLLARRAS